MDGCPIPVPSQAIQDLEIMACILEISHVTAVDETHFEGMSKMDKRGWGGRIYHLFSKVLSNLQKEVKPKICPWFLILNSRSRLKK